MKARDISFRVLANRELASGIYHAVLESQDGSVPEATPGQFAMVRARESSVPLLRRPMSYLEANEGRIEIAYRVVGIGTRILAEVGENGVLQVLGPLGTGFRTSMAKSKALLVAGGMGISPIFFLAKALREKGVPEVEVVYGASTSDELVFADIMEKAGVEVRRVTEDGSAGRRGMASNEVVDSMRRSAPEAIFACGPEPMLKAVAVEAKRPGIPCQVSIEARMACGVGACLGCAVKTIEGYKHTCCDGPVFDAEILFGIA